MSQLTYGWSSLILKNPWEVSTLSPFRDLKSWPSEKLSYTTKIIWLTVWQSQDFTVGVLWFSQSFWVLPVSDRPSIILMRLTLLMILSMLTHWLKMHIGLGLVYFLVCLLTCYDFSLYFSPIHSKCLLWSSQSQYFNTYQ